MSTSTGHSAEGLLLVAHGTRSSAGTQEALAFGAVVAATRPDVAVATGFLELTDPPASVMLEELVAARRCRRVTVQPLMLFSAGHGKNDVPRLLLDARARYPHVEFVLGSPLGVVPEMLSAAGNRIAAAGAGGLPLVVVARGTSDPDANSDACKAARLLAEWTCTSWVEVAFSGVTFPTVGEVLQRAARLGHERIALFFWFLATGRLIERGRTEAADFARSSGVEVVDAGYFGPDPLLVPVVWQRQAEATAGRPRVNCDVCAYRAEWPGLAHRVGQPRGIGHSELAASHHHRQGLAQTHG